jgi:hypothetical protein
MIGWLGNIFILSGILALAYRRRWGFILGVVGNSFWCYRGYSTGQYDLITIEVIIVVLQAFSWWRWRQNVRGTCQVCQGTGRTK